MTVPLRTFALFGLALAMLAGGYWFAPSPGSASMPTPVAKAAPPSEPTVKPVPTLVASRPPVPLVTQPRTSFFTQTTAEKPTSDNKSVNLGVFTTNALSSDAQPGVAAAQPRGDDSQAKKAIEFDGYRNVRGLEKAPDGTWRGRAMRGRTEVAVKVDASGNVSAE
jgi:hypothetical protein